jgi:hypothetical protein
MGYFFLGLSFLGAVAPYAFLGQQIASGHITFQDIKLEALANPVSSYLLATVIVAMITSWVFIITEGRRLRMKGLWLPFLATILIGVACGLPLFLFMRKLTVDRLDALLVQPEPPPPVPVTVTVKRTRR